MKDLKYCKYYKIHIKKRSTQNISLHHLLVNGVFESKRKMQSLKWSFKLSMNWTYLNLKHFRCRTCSTCFVLCFRLWQKQLLLLIKCNNYDIDLVNQKYFKVQAKLILQWARGSISFHFSYELMLYYILFLGFPVSQH